MNRASLETVRRALQGLVPPEPPPALLQRILDSRAAGVRVALPRVGRDSTRWLVVALAAAGVLALIVSIASHDRPMGGNTDYREIAEALSFWPRAAMAQQAGPVRTPRYDLVHRVDASRLLAGTWTYDICATTDEALTKCGSRLTIMVREAQRAEQPTWLMVQRLAELRDWSSAKDTIYVPPDTTYFARQTLRPLNWSLTGDRIRVVRQFTPDSLREAVDITGPHPRSWRTSARLPGAPDEPLVLRWARFDVALLLQALPLARGWRGSVYSVGLIGRVPGASPFPPLDFRVVGSERIDVPAGEFDCWRVEMRIGDETAITLWASKERRWLIKMEERWLDWRRDYALASATPRAP